MYFTYVIKVELYSFNVKNKHANIMILGIHIDEAKRHKTK